MKICVKKCDCSVEAENFCLGALDNTEKIKKISEYVEKISISDIIRYYYHILGAVMIKKNYKKTLTACYLGFVTQAISANFSPLLFLTFKDTYGISLEKIALIPVIFYLTQLLVDFAKNKKF